MYYLDVILPHLAADFDLTAVSSVSQKVAMLLHCRKQLDIMPKRADDELHVHHDAQQLQSWLLSMPAAAQNLYLINTQEILVESSFWHQYLF